MTRDDVIRLFQIWRSAGLRPPVSINSPEQGNQMIDAFYGQYKRLTGEEVAMLGQKLSRLQYWPRFYDVDDALTEMHRTRSQASTQSQGMTREERIKAREALMIAVLGREPNSDESWTEAMARKYAKLHYPETTENFINENKLQMAAQLEQDYICDNCRSKSIQDCPTGGHLTFLRIDPEGGFCTQCVDIEPCGKACVSLLPEPEDARPKALPQRRCGGFTSATNVISMNRQNWNKPQA